MTACYSCGRTIKGTVHRSTIGKPACRGCSNLQVGAVIGTASGASTGETLGLIHILNSWRTGTRKSKARDEAEHIDPCLRSIAQANGLSGLSMGMSGDFEAAIEGGSTCVRVGQAIFGARATPDSGGVSGASR